MREDRGIKILTNAAVVIILTAFLAATAAARTTTTGLRVQANHEETLIGTSHAWTRFGDRTRRAHRFWTKRTRALRPVYVNPPHKSGWLCIHRGEGAWNDSGDPYWGGLQMDRDFMAAYAPWFLLRRGYANRWSPLEQMWVAERAHRSGRGYWPWPNTARYCGLL